MYVDTRPCPLPGSALRVVPTRMPATPGLDVVPCQSFTPGVLGDCYDAALPIVPYLEARLLLRHERTALTGRNPPKVLRVGARHRLR